MDNNDNTNGSGGTPDLPYDKWVEESLRSVIHRAIDHVARGGLPGEHHFYITFRTGHPGAAIPDHLRAQHPETMTIVLQHQFDNLLVDDDHFEVTLRFGGRPERLVIPFSAMTAFHDPAVNFGLQLNVRELAEALSEGGDLATDGGQMTPSSATVDAIDDDTGAEQTGEVIALDQFRKK